MTTIQVPDIEGPMAQLCWKQNLEPPHTMVRCDRKKGHAGPHSWERLSANDQLALDIHRDRQSVRG